MSILQDIMDHYNIDETTAVLNITIALEDDTVMESELYDRLDELLIPV